MKFFSVKAGDSTPLTKYELSRVFNFLDEEDQGCISKVAYGRFTRHYMKVTKDMVLTAELNVKDGKTVRRLEKPEILEVVEGPVKEESANLIRVRCKVMKDDLEGWASFSGNQGSVFLEDGGNLFKVIKETILTDACDLAEVKFDGTKPRKLKEGELLEVREWPAKQEGSGLTRMMCRAKADGRIGWATTLGNTGIKFIEHA